MAVNIRANSRFVNSTPILTRDGIETFGIMKKFRFLDRSNLSEDNIRIFVADSRAAGRPDLIALDFYKNSDLHWIPILFNRVENPFSWPLNGQVIELPSPAAVFTEI